MACPHIANFFPEEHNKIAEMLGLPLLWACFDTAAQHLVASEVQTRIVKGYNHIRGENNKDYNPVEKVLLHVY
jgi:hypothetical protein